MSYAGIFTDKNNVDHPVTAVLYGTCATEAATAAKVVTCTDFDTLMTGVTIRVKFTNRNTAQSPTLNINNTGAKSVYRFGSVAPVNDDSWEDGAVVELVYDGTSFFMVNSDDIGNLYNSLDNKQPKTDNNLQTTDKTIVGGINELKSGLTNLDSEVNGDATTYPYASSITIEDAIPANVADCNVKIEPVQDLHGYDHPWVGGAGKNLLPITLANLKSLNTNGTWTDNVYERNGVTFTVNTDDGGNVTSIEINNTASTNTALVLAHNADFDENTSYIFSGCPNGGSTSTYFLQYSNMVDNSYDDTGSGVTFSEFSHTTYTNRLVMIVLGVGTTVSHLMFYPMIRLATETDATFAPYTNICPISGHTEASVQRDGRNLVEGTIENCNINSTGLLVSESNYNVSYGRVFANKQYTISSDDAAGAVYAFYTDVPIKTSVSYDGNRTASNNKTFTAPIDGYVAFRTSSSYTQAQLELGSTATPYVPYAGKTYTISLGDTIYGGTVDFDSGVMTVDRAIKDLGTLSYTYDSSVRRFGAVVSDIKQVAARTLPMVCSCYEVIDDGRAIEYVTDGSIYTINNYIEIHDYRYTNPSDLETALDGMQLVYPLATPFTIQLTPQQIQLLKGQNTLTASTGDISVTVNGVSGSIGAVQEQVNATDAALAELADKLPTAPTTDGAYVLTVTVADGTPTYSWESAT